MTESHQPEAVILDTDGVLTRTARLHAEAWKAMFDPFLQGRTAAPAKARRPFDIDVDYRRYVDGKPRYDGVRSFLESRGLDLPRGDAGDPPQAETVCGLGNRKNEIFHRFLKRTGVEAYPDAVEQLAFWKQENRKLAAISASRNCRQVIESAGLLKLFDTIVDGNDTARLGLRGKPAPDVFLQAAKELGVEADEAMVIEDAIAGVQAGREGRFGWVVGVARDRDGADLREAGAHRVVQDLRELREIRRPRDNRSS